MSGDGLFSGFGHFDDYIDGDDQVNGTFLQEVHYITDYVNIRTTKTFFYVYLT
jgi:hypothetical protein